MCEEIFGPVVTAYAYPDAKWERDARCRRSHVAVRADRRGLRPRSRGDQRGVARAAKRGRQLLHQRQAHRRGRRAAAVRRRARIGHQRQGRFEDEPAALGERAGDEGDVLASARRTPTRTCRRADARSGASPPSSRSKCTGARALGRGERHPRVLDRRYEVHRVVRRHLEEARGRLDAADVRQPILDRALRI